MARRRRFRRHRRQGGSSPLIALLLVGGLLSVVLLLTMGGIGLWIYSTFQQDLPSPEALTRQSVGGTQIFDRNGELLYEILDPQEGRKATVPLSDISPWVIQATLATEDADFYRHPGINLRGLARAAWVYLTGQGPLQGGSSITQQLVKNTLLEPEERFQRTLTRKAREILLALEVERRYSKEQILEWYLNQIYYGDLSYGIQAAAESYFGLPAHDLNLAQAAMLVGLPQAPARYSPRLNPEAAKARQETVLDIMVRQGGISQEQAEEAKAQELHYGRTRFDIQAPHFVQFVRDILQKRYGSDLLIRGGLKVTTTLDLNLQRQGEELVRQHVERLRSNQVSNAALVALRPGTGEVLAMVGSVDFFDESIDGQVNIALAERQPGSSFKPFTYITAFQKGYTPATMLLDVRGSFPDGLNPPYVPDNVDFRYRGPVSVREALAMSLNVPAVRTLAFAGVKDTVATAHRLGITTLTRPNTYGLSLTLGGGEVRLLDLAYAYSVFARGGIMVGIPMLSEELRPGMRELEPVVVLRVEDSYGRVLYRFQEPEQRAVLDPRLAYLITDILADNEARTPLFGPRSPLYVAERPAAVKTGSSDDYRDTWAIGYTPDLVVGVWVGNTDNTPMKRVMSTTTAGPIWHDFLVAATADTPPKPFPKPPGLVQSTVCVPSGLVPTLSCPKTHEALLLQGTEPTTRDNLWQPFRLDRATGRLASATTPPQSIQEQVYLVLPPEADDWIRENNIPQPPREYAPLGSGIAAITAPSASASVRGQVAIQGNTAPEGFTRYLLEYSPGLNPQTWVAIGSGTEVVRGGLLKSWDTTALADGLYTLRLTVVTQDGRPAPAPVTVPVRVDNKPPQLRIAYPTDQSRLLFDSEKTRNAVGIQAEVSDLGGVNRVEFFADGQSLGFTTVYPYNREWLFRPGPHLLYAIAYDQAGNAAQSEPIAVAVEAVPQGLAQAQR